MNKTELLNLLNNQKNNTKKSTRKNIIDVVMKCVNKHIDNNDLINGITASKKTGGVNLGDTMEVVAKKVILTYNNINTTELTRDLTKKVLELNRELTPAKLKNDGTPYKNGAKDLSKAVYDYVIKHDHMDKKGDLIVRNQSIELKFSTSDAPATPLKETKANKVIIITWNAMCGGLVFECEPNQVVVDSRGRVVNNQKAKYINQVLTNLMFD